MRVLLAVDESPYSEDAVNEVGARTWTPDTIIRVLHVVEKFVPPAAELGHDAGGSLERAEAEIVGQNQELIDRVAQWLREQGLSVETVMREGDPRKMIVDEAKEWGADLIVIGSHGFTGVKRLLLGSVAQSVVDHAPCSVEVVHQKHAGDKSDAK